MRNGNFQLYPPFTMNPARRNNLLLLNRGSIIEAFHKLLLRRNLEEPKPRAAVYPYISGDAFLALADIAHLDRTYGKSPIQLRHKLPGAPILHFVEIDQLCTNTLKSRITRNSLVIFHNGDDSLTAEVIEYLRHLECLVFATNARRQKGFIEPIPIGLENIHHRRNGSLHHYNPLNLAAISRVKTRNVLVSFSIHTNPAARLRVLGVCQQYGYENKLMKTDEFRQRLAETRFLISPPGNGIDCHRTWEAMYNHVVPVIEAPYNLFQHVDLPILTVNSYHDFFRKSPGELESLHCNIMSRGYPAIYMDYWIDLINKVRHQSSKCLF